MRKGEILWSDHLFMFFCHQSDKTNVKMKQCLIKVGSYISLLLIYLMPHCNSDRCHCLSWLYIQFVKVSLSLLSCQALNCLLF